MAIPVTRTKLIRPRRRSEIVSRQRLLDLLYDLMEYKLTILAAPAGYGKTSLLIDFTQQADLTTCWYAIDPLDQDPQRFFTYFIAAISQQFPNFGKSSLAVLEALNPARLDLDLLVTTIINEAIEHIREHFILVLDDYHLINEQKEIGQFINRFIQGVDENCHLILSTRALLALPDMPLMVARSMVAGLSFEELAFRPEEIQSLILQNYHQSLTRNAAEDLAAATEGWITGLLLSTQINGQEMPDRGRIARVARVSLYDYLAQQVLDGQPEPVRDFLLRSSLLEEFDIQLCQDVLGQSQDHAHLFHHVLQNNLFVLPVGENGMGMRYHHLFRDFLQARIEKDDPQGRIRILQKLAAVYAEREEWEKARAVLQELKDWERLADLIERAGWSLIKNSRLVTLAEWIDALPPDLVLGRPTLQSLRAAAYEYLGQVDNARALLVQAEAAQRQANDWPGLLRTMIRRSFIESSIGNYEVAVEKARQALSISRAQPGLENFQPDLLRALGISLYQVGQTEEAFLRLQESLEGYMALQDLPNIATLQMEIGVAHQSSGRNRLAMEHYEKALSFWKDARNTTRQANLLNNLGVLRYLMGEYEQAAMNFDEALLLARQNRYLRLEALTLNSIADLYSDLQGADAALDAYRMALGIAQRLNNHFLLVYANLGLAGQYRSIGKLELAKRYLTDAENIVVEKGSAYEAGLYQLEAGRFSYTVKHFPEALNHFEQALRRLDEAGQSLDALRARLFLAAAEHSRGKDAEALQELGHVFGLASRLENSHVLVVAGQATKSLLVFAARPQNNFAQAVDLLAEISRFETNLPSIRKRLRTRAASLPFSSPKLTIQTLGKVSVERDGNPVTAPEWQNQRKVRELFFYFLVHPQGLTKEEIGLVFWPDSSNARLKLQFKNALYRLRHALGADIILFDENEYWFNQELDYQYDAENFTRSIEEASKATAPEIKIAAYQVAIKIYRGPFLPDAEGSWVSSERQRLRELYLNSNLELARLYFSLSSFQEALVSCQRALDEDACLEEAHRIAMQIHAARGSRVDVSRQFERCRQALLQEVGAQPSPQTTSLYEALIR